MTDSTALILAGKIVNVAARLAYCNHPSTLRYSRFGMHEICTNCGAKASDGGEMISPSLVNELRHLVAQLCALDPTFAATVDLNDRYQFKWAEDHLAKRTVERDEIVKTLESIKTNHTRRAEVGDISDEHARFADVVLRLLVYLEGKP